MNSNIHKQNFKIDCDDRNELNGHKSFLVWFTGLSGSGKSTLSNAVEQAIFQKGVHTYALDGDNTRMGLNKDLGFNSADRTENIRRVAEVANLMVDAGLVVFASFISPYQKDRDMVKSIVGEENYVEIYVNTSVEECEKRDVKGLYQKARTGEIEHFTGISAPYEAPANPDIAIDTAGTSIESSIEPILRLIEEKLELK